MQQQTQSQQQQQQQHNPPYQQQHQQATSSHHAPAAHSSYTAGWSTHPIPPSQQQPPPHYPLHHSNSASQMRLPGPTSSPYHGPSPQSQPHPTSGHAAVHPALVHQSQSLQSMSPQQHTSHGSRALYAQVASAAAAAAAATLHHTSHQPTAMQHHSQPATPVGSMLTRHQSLQSGPSASTANTSQQQQRAGAPVPAAHAESVIRPIIQQHLTDSTAPSFHNANSHRHARRQRHRCCFVVHLIASSAAAAAAASFSAHCTHNAFCGQPIHTPAPLIHSSYTLLHRRSRSRASLRPAPTHSIIQSASPGSTSLHATASDAASHASHPHYHQQQQQQQHALTPPAMPTKSLQQQLTAARRELANTAPITATDTSQTQPAPSAARSSRRPSQSTAFAPSSLEAPAVDSSEAAQQGHSPLRRSQSDLNRPAADDQRPARLTRSIVIPPSRPYAQ